MPEQSPSPVLVRAESVTKVFSTRAGDVRAVDDVSLGIRRGETLGLVGESGSGKSTMARIVMGLQACTSGRVLFDGQDLAALPARELREVRPRLQMVFQNPYGSLLPHFTAIANVTEPLRLHGRDDKSVRRTRAWSCWSWSGSTRGTRTCTRGSSPVASSNGSRSPGRWPWSPTCWSATSRRRRSTSRSRRRSWSCSWTCARSSGSPACSSRTTSRWSSGWPTGSR